MLYFCDIIFCMYLNAEHLAELSDIRIYLL